MPRQGFTGSARVQRTHFQFLTWATGLIEVNAVTSGHSHLRVNGQRLAQSFRRKGGGFAARVGAAWRHRSTAAITLGLV
jgi:hypothetical protein